MRTTPLTATELAELHIALAAADGLPGAMDEFRQRLTPAIVFDLIATVASLSSAVDNPDSAMSSTDTELPPIEPSDRCAGRPLPKQ